MKKVHDFNVNYILKEKVMNKKNLLLSIVAIMSVCTPHIFAKKTKTNFHNMLHKNMEEIIDISQNCAKDLKGLLKITNEIKDHKETPKGVNKIIRSLLKKTPCLDAVYSMNKRAKIAITFSYNLVATAESHNTINDEISRANLTKQITDTIERLSRLKGTAHKSIHRLDKHKCAHTHNEDLNKLYKTLKSECKDVLEIAEDTIKTLEPYQKWLTQK